METSNTNEMKYLEPQPVNKELIELVKYLKDEIDKISNISRKRLGINPIVWPRIV